MALAAPFTGTAGGDADAAPVLAVTAPAPDRPLEGTTWVLHTVVTGHIAAPVPDGPRRPALTIAEGMASIETGCNRGWATVTINDDSVVFGPAATTRMACDDVAMLLERRVLDVVSDRTTRATITGDLLTLTTGTAALVYHAAG